MNWKVPKRPEYEKDEKGTEIEEIHFGRENQNENQITTKKRGIVRRRCRAQV